MTADLEAALVEQALQIAPVGIAPCKADNAGGVCSVLGRSPNKKHFFEEEPSEKRFFILLLFYCFFKPCDATADFVLRVIAKALR